LTAAPAIDADGNETANTDAGDKRQMVATISSAFGLAAAALKLTIYSNNIARQGLEGQLRPWISF